VNPSWLVLVTPVFLIGVLVVMGWIERRLTSHVVSDEVQRYLREPEPPDFVEAAVTRLLDSVAPAQERPALADFGSVRNVSEWAGAGSNRRPSAFQADARTD